MNKAWTIYELTYLQGMTIRQVNEITGVPIGTIQAIRRGASHSGERIKFFDAHPELWEVEEKRRYDISQAIKPKVLKELNWTEASLDCHKIQGDCSVCPIATMGLQTLPDPKNTPEGKLCYAWEHVKALLEKGLPPLSPSQRLLINVNQHSTKNNQQAS